MTAQPLARRSATRVRRVRPRGAEREKPVREARFKTPLHGRRCVRSTIPANSGNEAMLYS